MRGREISMQRTPPPVSRAGTPQAAPRPAPAPTRATVPPPPAAPERARTTPERILFTAAAIILVLGTQLPIATYVSPKSGFGYAIGIVGGVLILMQLLYALRKRLRAMRFLGSVAGWFQAHMMLGVVGPLCILIHCGFSLGATNSNIALVCMLLVAGSGIFGRYFYSKVHRGLYGRKASVAELQAKAQELRDRGTKLRMMPELMDRVSDEEQRIQSIAEWNGAMLIFAPVTIAVRFSGARGRLRRYARAAIKITATRYKPVANQRERFERAAFDYVQRRVNATREVVEFRIYERLFSVWHVLHVPLFVMLIAAGIVHVISVHVY